MNWATLFERARDHETTTETIQSTLAAVREDRASDDEARSDG